MVLVRHLLGGVLRRQRQRRGLTLREVSLDARVSLGYISEVERGQKEASSELLAAICAALDVPLSDVLREVSDEIDKVETRVLTPTPGHPQVGKVPARRLDTAPLDAKRVETARLDKRGHLDKTRLDKKLLDRTLLETPGRDAARLDRTRGDSPELETAQLDRAREFEKTREFDVTRDFERVRVESIQVEVDGVDEGPTNAQREIVVAA